MNNFANKQVSIRTRTPKDPLFLPWSIDLLPDDEFPQVLTVQAPSPYAGSNLIGFEDKPQMCEIITGQEGWEKLAIGKSPVFADKGGMYSVPGLKVTDIIITDAEGN